MPKFDVRVPHTLSKEEARSRLERGIEMLKAQYGGDVSDSQNSWDGDTLNFQLKSFGITIAGSIAVESDALVLHGDIPFAAMMFKGKIESEIRAFLEKLVAA
jgi:putative polyhydroxyalkanoate system protein